MGSFENRQDRVRAYCKTRTQTWLLSGNVQYTGQIIHYHKVNICMHVISEIFDAESEISLL